MGRKTQVTKEMILDGAFALLKEEGYHALNYRSVSARVGCSTQPIAWQFENLDGLKKELSKRVIATLQAIHPSPAELATSTENAFVLFLRMGVTQLNFFLEEKNLASFIRFSPLSSSLEERISTPVHKIIALKMMTENNLSAEDVRSIMVDCMLYAQGVTSMVMVGGTDIDGDGLRKLVVEHGIRVLHAFGIDMDEAREFAKRV